MTLRIKTTALPNAVVGQPYSFFLEAEGGDGSYEWEMKSGSLPDGLTLSSTGLISGTPTGMVRMADKIIYLERRNLSDGTWRHKVLFLYDSTADPLPFGEPVPDDLIDIMTSPGLEIEDAGVNAGDHVLRVHTFITPTGSSAAFVRARANENFAARKVSDVEEARAQRTVVVDAQRGVEIPVV